MIEKTMFSVNSILLNATASLRVNGDFQPKVIHSAFENVLIELNTENFEESCVYFKFHRGLKRVQHVLYSPTYGWYFKLHDSIYLLKHGKQVKVRDPEIAFQLRSIETSMGSLCLGEKNCSFRTFDKKHLYEWALDSEDIDFLGEYDNRLFFHNYDNEKIELYDIEGNLQEQLEFEGSLSGVQIHGDYVFLTLRKEVIRVHVFDLRTREEVATPQSTGITGFCSSLEVSATDKVWLIAIGDLLFQWSPTADLSAVELDGKVWRHLILDNKIFVGFYDNYKLSVYDSSFSQRLYEVAACPQGCSPWRLGQTDDHLIVHSTSNLSNVAFTKGYLTLLNKDTDLNSSFSPKLEELIYMESLVAEETADHDKLLIEIDATRNLAKILRQMTLAFQDSVIKYSVYLYGNDDHNGTTEYSKNFNGKIEMVFKGGKESISKVHQAEIIKSLDKSHKEIASGYCALPDGEPRDLELSIEFT